MTRLKSGQRIADLEGNETLLIGKIRAAISKRRWRFGCAIGRTDGDVVLVKKEYRRRDCSSVRNKRDSPRSSFAVARECHEATRINEFSQREV